MILPVLAGLKYMIKTVDTELWSTVFFKIGAVLRSAVGIIIKYRHTIFISPCGKAQTSIPQAQNTRPLQAQI